MSELRQTRATCCYCGVGCGVIIESDGRQVLGVKGDPEHPANFGRLCTKGSTLHLSASPVLQQQARALYPELRTERNAARERATWDASLDFIAKKFADTIAEHGPDSVGFYISGQLLTEDYYVFNKLAKGLIGTNNIDTNSRLCMSSAVAGYKQTLGADAPPACYEDIDLAEVVFIVGSNTAYAHPILYRRLEAARTANPKTEGHRRRPAQDRYRARGRPVPADFARHRCRAVQRHAAHLPVGRPDRCRVHRGAYRRFRATSGKPCATTRRPMSRKSAASARKTWWLPRACSASREATLSLYCQGLNQSASGTAKNAALINLHLATAQIGKPGAGPFSLTGQPNAMGGREVGGMANLLSAHRDLANPAAPRRSRAIVGCRTTCRPGPARPRSKCSRR